jgi:carbamoyl-phosphate synthase large subunit
MQDALTVLFTSAGRRNQLLKCFRDDAARLGVRLRILAADVEPELSPACHQADARFKVPRCTSAEYVPALMELCRRENVHLLVPTIDTELTALSLERETLLAAGVHALISSSRVVALANDKLVTAERFAAHGVPTPATVTLAEYRREPGRLRWPVIAKPNSGSASIGIVRPSKPTDLAELDAENYVVQELWQGNEYTVNVYFDLEGHLRCAVPHRRIEVRSGEVSKGRTERMTMLAGAASKLPGMLPGARGPLCFQAVVTESGDYAVFEINARFGGGYPLAHRAGARMSQWILEELTGRPCSAHDEWRAGTTMLRYDDAVFIDA